MPFQLVGITPSSLSDEQWTCLPEIFQAGLSLLYVRQAESPELKQRLTSDVLAPYRDQIIVPFEVPRTALRLHWKEAVRLQAPPNSQAFSTSIHDISDWPLLREKVKLAFYSPVFPSISKPGHRPSQPLTEQIIAIQHIRRHFNALPALIGLGGIRVDNVRQVQDAGFGGAAVLGTLWENHDPVDVVHKLSQQII
ncbi:thiamine phosphate synthase [Spirosoma rigui]|uniref:thiamine phosphate synthase n=1 Tax=Spirosoma rigui TaxID=564064 RepID=UPI0009B136C6|nr:thiamine phosphate synthase [Spirosoma rigui]